MVKIDFRLGKNQLKIVLFEYKPLEIGNLFVIFCSVLLWLEEEKIHAIPEKDLDRTSEEGKASSVQFVHFNFSPEQIEKFKNSNSKITLSIDHSLYRHSAEIIKETFRLLLKRLENKYINSPKNPLLTNPFW